MRNTDIIVFVSADETSEVGDKPSSSTTSDSRKRLDWAAQVESEQQEEADDTIQLTPPPQANEEHSEPRSGKRGKRRGWKNSKPSYVDEGVLTINICS